MSGIDPNIVVHDIKAYLDVNLVHQCLRPLHPKKFAATKAEVENIL